MKPHRHITATRHPRPSHLGRHGGRRGRGRGARGRSRGFTLVEMLIVIAIISLISFSLIASFGAGRRASATRAANQMAATMRFAFDKARTEGAYYRLEVDLDNGTFTLQKADEAMYMPATSRDGKRMEIDPDKLEDQAERDKRASESYFSSVQSKVLGSSADDTLDPYAVQVEEVPRAREPLFEQFDPANTVTGVIEPIELPERVKVVSVRTEHDFAPITEGKTYIYFFPQGRTQMTHIQLEDTKGEDKWTIMMQPLTGRVTIKGELIDLELPEDILEDEDELGNEANARSF